MRFFNTAGPCDPNRHYMLPPERRLPEVRGLIDRQHYFVLHAPRQTGKTTCFEALAHSLAAEGLYVALHATCEKGQPAGDETLLSVLRQLRAGYLHRPQRFPQSIALIGLRDVRDYRIHLRPESDSLGTSSPFNIKVRSLILANFSREEVAELYAQHTAEDG